MRCLLLALLCIFSPFAPNAAAELPSSISVTGALEIGPEGEVIYYRLDESPTPAIRSLIETSVASWRFEPVKVNDRAVKVKTRMNLELRVLSGTSNNYELLVERTRFPDLGIVQRHDKQPYIPAEYKRPRYPREAIRLGVGARVLMLIRIDTSGKILKTHPYQTNLSREISENDANRLRGSFETAVKKALRSWPSIPYEMDEDMAFRKMVLVPFQFSTDPGTDTSTYPPGPVSLPPWADPDEFSEGDPAILDDDEIDSRVFYLITEVVGKTL